VALHRRAGTWQRDVDAFIALTEFQRDRMVAAGLPADKVFVKPNFYPGQPAVVPWTERDDCVVFAGRLTEEKGVMPLVRAWSVWGEEAPELRIVGDGALRRQLESVAQQGTARIKFLGQLSPARAEAEIGRARLLIVPSICFEGFPMVLREAFAFGTPAAVSGIGPLPGIVQHGHTGVVFRANDPASLLETTRELWRSPDRLATMSAHARRDYEDKYAESANYEQLLRIYERAIAVHDQRGAA
jgi:glycosyltransferase involved in cell wall biosynthesis